MKDDKFWKVFDWVLRVLIIALVLELAWIGNFYFTNRNRTAAPSMVLPTPIAQDGQPYEHCVIMDDTAPALMAGAGTPVPTIVFTMNTPVATETTIEQPTAVPTIDVPTELPMIPEPTPIPTEVPPEIDFGEVVQVGTFDSLNYHVVVVGVGYGPESNQNYLIGTIMGLYRNFEDVNVDFAFGSKPITVNFTGVPPNAELSDADLNTLFSKIRSLHPTDTLVLYVNTNEDAYVQHSGEKNYIVLTGSDNRGVNSVYAGSHEIAHALGLNDGYDNYIERHIPGSELFYEDEMPIFLVRAIEELGYIPPIYESGICNGKKIVRFWAKDVNIMSNMSGVEPTAFPWGEGVFSPLQEVVMNQYIESLKGK